MTFNVLIVLLFFFLFYLKKCIGHITIDDDDDYEQDGGEEVEQHQGPGQSGLSKITNNTAMNVIINNANHNLKNWTLVTVFSHIDHT